MANVLTNHPPSQTVAYQLVSLANVCRWGSRPFLEDFLAALQRIDVDNGS